VENRKARDPNVDCDRKVKADENWMIITYSRTLYVPRWILCSRTL